MLQPSGFLLNPLLTVRHNFPPVLQTLLFNAVPSIAISLRPLMFARWVKSRWLTALAIASSCRHGCSNPRPQPDNSEYQ